MDIAVLRMHEIVRAQRCACHLCGIGVLRQLVARAVHAEEPVHLCKILAVRRALVADLCLAGKLLAGFALGPCAVVYPPFVLGLWLERTDSCSGVRVAVARHHDELRFEHIDPVAASQVVVHANAHTHRGLANVLDAAAVAQILVKRRARGENDPVDAGGDDCQRALDRESVCVVVCNAAGKGIEVLKHLAEPHVAKEATICVAQGRVGRERQHTLAVRVPERARRQARCGMLGGLQLVDLAKKREKLRARRRGLEHREQLLARLGSFANTSPGIGGGGGSSGGGGGSGSGNSGPAASRCIVVAVAAADSKTAPQQRRQPAVVCH
eukprot:comp22181_c0_seq1/m.52204 comp22181_c0_seq1/g.52204  ORF comp22181_c0_seq1/g.52204 comp22181_c0_seq1/m.52204 type:complete len:325 (-) comp22181_c0_seq1:35-1009(-)